MYGQLTQCMSLNLEALDRFDWITAQLQEVSGHGCHDREA